MNFLAWFGIGAPASMWLAHYAFNTLHQDALGFIGIVLFILSIAMGIHAASADWSNLFHGDEGED